MPTKHWTMKLRIALDLMALTAGCIGYHPAVFKDTQAVIAGGQSKSADDLENFGMHKRRTAPYDPEAIMSAKWMSSVVSCCSHPLTGQLL